MEDIIGKLEELREYVDDTVHPECDYNIYLALISMVDEITGDVEKALEKQIAKKPNYEGDGYDKDGNIIYDTWYCPCCNSRFEVDYDDWKYCPNCGQKLDWSRENDK